MEKTEDQSSQTRNLQDLKTKITREQRMHWCPDAVITNKGFHMKCYLWI